MEIKKEKRCKEQVKDQKNFLIPPHPLTNFEIQMYNQNEARLNGVFWTDNLPNKIKDGAYIINLEKYPDAGTHWIILFCKNNEIFYFHIFELNMFLKKLKNLLSIKT